jgi:hypothetical protein
VDGSSDDASIRDLVLAGLASGVLWILEADPIWKGLGVNKQCIVCRRRITDREIQYDVPGPRGALPAHGECHIVWRAVSDRMRRNPPP